MGSSPALLALLALLTLAPLPALATPPTGRLNDTALTRCYDGSNLVTCNAANSGDTAPYPGQDARFGRDAAAASHSLTKIGGGAGGFDFTPLDGSGNPIPLTNSNGNGVPTSTPACVRDNVTNLVWEVKTNANKNDNYSWGDASGVYAASKNTPPGLCGYSSGWRLPTRRELLSIVDGNIIEDPFFTVPMVDGNFFPQTMAGFYWSSDNGNGLVWGISFANGESYWAGDPAYVRLVHSDGPSPTQAYVDHGDGTVTDTTTGLMWDKCTYQDTTAQCSNWRNAITYTWQQALAVVPGVNALNGGAGYKGYNDWRLPNVNELESLVKPDMSNPALDTDLFPIGFYRFWTASLCYHGLDSTNAWQLIFYLGDKKCYPIADNDSRAYIRLVRGGQAFATTDLLPDITPPWLSALSVTRPWPTTQVTLNATSNESGTGYWLLVPRHAAAPTAAQVKAGVNYPGVTVIARGSGPMAAGHAAAFAITGWGDQRFYDLHIVAEDAAGNLSEVGTVPFATVPIYTVTASVSPAAGGTATCIPAMVDAGSPSTCTSTPTVGYTFANWSGDCSGAVCTFGSVTANQAVTANFTLNHYAVATTALPPAGGTLLCGPNPVGYGQNSTCTATPAPGYTFAGWSGDCSGTTCLLSNVTGTRAVTGTFTPIPYGVTAVANPTAGGQPACVPAVVHYDDSSSCSANPNPGYAFIGWSGACAGLNPTCGLSSIRSDTSAIAQFAPLFAESPLNDGGQTLCYDGTSLAACTDTTTGDAAPYPRQDGRFGRDPAALTGHLVKQGGGAAGFDFTPLDASGAVIALSHGLPAAPPACLRDNTTGLIWSAQTLTATWAAANTAAASQVRCGQSLTWRLPSRRELLSIVHNGAGQPAIDSNFFPGTLSSAYWSGDAYGPNPANAWWVDFADGASGTDAKSASHPVRLVSNDINHAPSFTKGADQTVWENAGLQTVPGWATQISSGDVTTQAVHFVLNSDNPGLFSVAPAIDAQGTLTYTPAPRVNGSATVTVRLVDDGGIANGGSDTSAPQTFVIRVNYVNQPPTLTLGPDVVMNVFAPPGPTAIPGWATHISAGGANESGQHLTASLRLLDVTDQKAMTFSSPPTLDLATGTLSYTTQFQDYGNGWTISSGLARVEVTVHDDGGTANGGADTFVAGTFTIFFDPTPVAANTSVRHPWHSPCIPVVLGGWDVGWDSRTWPNGLPAGYVPGNPYDVYRLASVPQHGFLTEMMGPFPDGGYMLMNERAYDVLPDGSLSFRGHNWDATICYIPFSATWTGSDTFTFTVVSPFGLESQPGTVTIEVYQQ